MTYVLNNKKIKTQKQKNKAVETGFGISETDKKRAVAVPYLIDTNKRTPKNKEPRIKD